MGDERELAEKVLLMSTNPDTPSPPTLWTYQQAAAYLGVNLNTLYGWVHERRIPHIRLSARTVRFDPVELQDWIDARRIR